jgi:alkaline phosphatase D
MVPMIRTTRRSVLATALLAFGTPAFSADPTRPITKIVFGSCIKQDQRMPIFDAILREEPQLCLLLGDNIYADTDDMQVMKSKYARLAENPKFDRLRKACPILATWDDHDYGRNDAGADNPHRDAAQQVFVDFWNDPSDSPRRQRPGVYDAQMFGPEGRRVQVILLDTRYFRSPLKRGVRRLAGPYLPDDDPAKTMLGEDQWRWLEQQLRIPAEVRLLGTSIQCLPEAAGQETWANLPRERQRLLDLIRSTRANGVVLLSGDRHWSELSVVNENVPYPLYELTSSSLNQIHARGTPSENRYRHLPTTFHHPNFGLVGIDWDSDPPTLSLQIRDAGGSLQLEKLIRLSELHAAE